MISQRSLLGLCLAFVATASLSLVGCGGSECGDGTIEQDGECVLAEEVVECEEGQVIKDGECVAEIGCGENTTEEDGQCVADDPVSCSGDTELDPNTNNCYPTEDVCGDNTAFSSSEDRCVPTADVCDDGTFYDEDSGLCFPDASCQSGDVIVDGVCVGMGESLYGEAEVLAEGNTNPEMEGTPAEITVPAKGDDIVFGGTINAPADADGDQEVDFFSFEASAGDWFEISVYSAGIPNPGFGVFHEGEDGTFERLGPVLTSRDKTRQIVAPYDGEYWIGVAPESTLLESNESPLGGADWNYAGTLTSLETPDAETHEFTAGSYEGMLGSLSDNFIVVDEFDAGASVALNWDVEPSGADPILSVWSSATELVEEVQGGTTVTVPESGEFYLVFDWYIAWSTIGLDFEVSAQELVTLADGDDQVIEFTAETGDVIEVTQENAEDEAVDAVLTDAGGNEVAAEELDVNLSGIMRYIGLEAGDYTLTLTNNSGAEITEMIVNHTLISPTVIDDVEATYTGTGHESRYYNQEYFLLESDQAAAWIANIDGVEFYSNGYLYGFFYGLGNDLLDETGSITSSNPSDTLNLELDADTPYILRIGGDSSSTVESWSADFELTFDELVILEDGGTVDVDVTVADGDILVISQDNDGDLDADITITDSNGDVITEETLAAGNEYTEEDLAAGDYTVTFTNNSGESMVAFENVVEAFDPTLFEVTETTLEGDVIVMGQTNSDGNPVDYTIVNANGDVVAEGTLPEGTEDGDVERLIDVPAGEHTITLSSMSPASDFVESVEIITPDIIDDFDATYAYTGSEYIFATQNYAIVEFAEQTTYEITLTNLAGHGGGVRLFVYNDTAEFFRGSSEAWSSSGLQTSATYEVTFAADTLYVLRIGNDWTFADSDYNAELTFSEVVNE